MSRHLTGNEKRRNGRLADVAQTLLALMGMEKWREMTGESSIGQGKWEELTLQGELSGGKV